MSDIENIPEQIAALTASLNESDRRLRQSTLTKNKGVGTLILTIPWSIVEAMKLDEGIDVELEIINNTIVVTPQVKTEFSLEELLAGVTPENCHDEIDWGADVEGEAW